MLITPSVVGLELAWLGKVPGRAAVLSISALLAGICVATLLDKQARGSGAEWGGHPLTPVCAQPAVRGDQHPPTTTDSVPRSRTPLT